MQKVCVCVFVVKSTDIREGEFYQFCYVTASGAVRGVSSAFEIFDRTDDDDMVIINPSETGYTSISSCGVGVQEWQQIMDEKRQQGLVSYSYILLLYCMYSNKEFLFVYVTCIVLSQSNYYIKPCILFLGEHGFNAVIELVLWNSV
jgi:hypothetical protein